MSTPTELANPNIGMENFITGLQDAGMAEAVKATKEPEQTEAIAPATPPPKKEAAPAAAPKAEPAKETPKETPPSKPEDDDKKWPRNAKDWEAYKQADKARLDALSKERDEIRSERDKIKAEIEQVRKQGPSPELEALKKERDEYDQRLKAIAVERHPKFEQFYSNKINTQLELAKRIVNKDISGLLTAPDGPIKEREIAELMETLSPLQQSRLGSVMNSLDELNAEKRGEIEKAKANYETVMRQEKEAQEKQQQQFQKMFDDSVRSASDPKEGNPAFQKREGDEAWNSEVDKRVEAARNVVFGNMPADKLIRSAMDAVALPSVLTMLKGSMEKVASLEKQISELQAATPRVEGGKGKEVSSGAESTATSLRPGYTDPMTALNEGWMKGLKREMEQ